MARIRTIKPEFWEDEKISTLSDKAKLLFIGIWNFSDDVGVCRGSAAFLRSRVFPYEDLKLKELDSLVAELENGRFIQKSIINGESFILVKNWEVHQKIDRPSKKQNISGTHQEISLLFDEHSSNIRRAKQEDSLLDKDRERDKDRDITLVDSIDSESVENFLKCFNENRGELPEVKKLSTNRKKKVKLRLKENPSLDYWRGIFIKTAASPFLTGKITNFKANFDWLITNESNHVKVFEGNYDQSEKVKSKDLTFKQKAEEFVDNALHHFTHNSKNAFEVLGRDSYNLAKEIGIDPYGINNGSIQPKFERHKWISILTKKFELDSS